MIIKKFESFSGDEPYTEVYVDAYLINYNRHSIFLNNEDLLFIFNNMKIEKDTLIFYYDSYNKYKSRRFEFTSSKFAYNFMKDRELYKITIGSGGISIFKDDDYFYWVNTQDGKYFKCDELSGLKELLKKLDLYID